MKITTTVLNRQLLCAALAAFGLSQTTFAGEPTAFDLIKEGNRYVGEDVKDKVLQIRSEKSIGSLTPNIWVVVYYDSDASAKTTEVKFGAGQKLEVKRPGRAPWDIPHADKVMDQGKLNTDSDKAIKTATKEPLLDKLTLKATQLRLEKTPDGTVWKVRVWAAKIKKPDQDVDIGEVVISAETGKVIRTDLHINKVD
jgi:hypothetical protein